MFLNEICFAVLQHQKTHSFTYCYNYVFEWNTFCSFTAPKKLTLSLIVSIVFWMFYILQFYSTQKEKKYINQIFVVAVHRRVFQTSWSETLQPETGPSWYAVAPTDFAESAPVCRDFLASVQHRRRWRVGGGSTWRSFWGRTKFHQSRNRTTGGQCCKTFFSVSLMVNGKMN